MTTEELAEVLKTVNANRPQVTQTMNFNAPIGQQIAHVDKIEAHFDKDMGMQVVNADAIIGDNRTESNQACDEELFRFIHPEVDEAQAVAVHKQVKRLVERFGIQQICDYLTQLANERKILLPQKTNVAYDELVRMGMPNGEGYALKTFEKYYRK